MTDNRKEIVFGLAVNTPKPKKIDIYADNKILELFKRSTSNMVNVSMMRIKDYDNSPIMFIDDNVRQFVIMPLDMEA